MIKRKICFVTTSRADYGLLSILIDKFLADKKIETKIIVTGSHLSKYYGYTADEIKIKNSISIKLFEKVMTRSDISEIIEKTINKFSILFKKTKPSVLVVLGDRFETFAVCTAAFVNQIPIAHIHGGEKTEGSFDDIFRHCITKLSNLHFVTTQDYKKRVIQLGENPKFVFNVGSLGAENINKLQLFKKSYMQKKYKLKIKQKIILICLHPETYGKTNNTNLVNELMKSLILLKESNIIFTASNADNDGHIINKHFKEFAKKNKNTIFLSSLGHINYLSMLKISDLVIGNSSSGIIEAPSLKTPTINIGNRQKGRVSSKSVISCEVNSIKIKRAIKRAFSKKFKEKLKNIKNPYSKKNTSINIYKILKLSKNLNKNKIFYDL